VGPCPGCVLHIFIYIINVVILYIYIHIDLKANDYFVKYNIVVEFEKTVWKGAGGSKPHSLLNIFARCKEFRCREKRSFQSTNCCVLDFRSRYNTYYIYTIQLLETFVQTIRSFYPCSLWK